MHSKIAIALLPALVVATPVPQTASAPDPSQIQIVNSAYSGSGCPQGSVSTTTSLDKTVITYGFDKFQTYWGPGTAASDHSKNCQLHLTLKYPGGFQYSVVDATYHGWARMDEGVTGSFVTSYYFSQDASKTSTTRSSFTGGGDLLIGQVYTKEDKVETTATVWSPCGTTGILNINNRVALGGDSSSTGELSNDDATVAFTQQLHVSWRACSPSSGNSGDGGENNIGIGKGSTEVDF